MALFVQPLFRGQNAAGLLSKQAKPRTRGNGSATVTKLRPIFNRLEVAVRQACGIYTQHIFQTSSMEQTNLLLEQLKTTVEGIPIYCPGEQALAWVYFVAAAESKLEEHRNFFVVKLRELFDRIPFPDTAQTFAMLDCIWNNPFLASTWTKVPMI